MSYTPPLNLAQQARQQTVAQATVPTSGNVIITFPQIVTQGITATGTITVYDSPLQANWVIKNNGLVIDVTSGQSSVGNIQVSGMDTLTVECITSVGNKPGNGGLFGFLGQVIHATFDFVSSPTNQTPLVIPQHDTLLPANSQFSSIPALTTSVFSTGTPPVATLPIPMIPGLPYVVFTFLNVGSFSSQARWLITVTGLSSGTVYGVFNFKNSSNQTLQGISFWVEVTSPQDMIPVLPNPTFAPNGNGLLLTITETPVAGPFHVAFQASATAVSPTFPNPTGPVFITTVNCSPGVAANIPLPSNTANCILLLWGYSITWEGVTTAGNLTVGVAANDVDVAPSLIVLGAGSQTISIPQPLQINIAGGTFQCTNNFVGGLAAVNCYFSYIIY